MENEKNVWYDELLEFYTKGIINEEGLEEAVAVGWINSEEKMLIIGIGASEKLN